MRPYQQSDLPDWLSALLLQRYPQNPAGLSLLTLALRPAATSHLVVQPVTPEALLNGYELQRVQADYPLPTPIYQERQQQAAQRRDALHRLHHDLERLNQHGPDTNLQQRVDYDRQQLEHLGLPREAQP